MQICECADVEEKRLHIFCLLVTAPTKAGMSFYFTLALLNQSNNLMEFFKPIEQLDAVLKTLADSKNNRLGITLGSIAYEANVIERGKIVGLPDINLVLDKLIKDKYVEVNVYSNPKPENRYSITFEGYFFIKEEGGYSGRYNLQSSEKNRLDNIEKDQIKRDESIKKLTAWVAIGTVAAAIIALVFLIWQIYTYYHPIINQ